MNNSALAIVAEGVRDELFEKEGEFVAAFTVINHPPVWVMGRPNDDPEDDPADRGDPPKIFGASSINMGPV